MNRKQPFTEIRFCYTSFLLIALLLIIQDSLFAAANPGQANAVKEVGLVEGRTAPHFHAIDQSGIDQSDTSIAGRNGTVLLFFRSADW
jgi:hypothetical protein